MQRTFTKNLRKSLSDAPRAWTRFWFHPVAKSSANPVRQLLSLLVGLLSLISMFWVPEWLSADGWLGLDAGRYFIGDGMPGTGSDYRWSLLFRWSTPSVATGICVIGLVASVLMFTGVAGRWAVLGAWACLITIHHRAPWLTLPSEVLASAALLYLAIEPGSVLRIKQAEAAKEESSSVFAN
ncbi:MAG: hypothetical protein ACKN82_14955, partial [Pirellula sp.]